ncbi:MAG: glycoside hydrolase family 32 protein [Lachnospiraceae bacterium]|nr:glycoside hydrolase family 32 protein [Lachnospiraceae bacterium]
MRRQTIHYYIGNFDGSHFYPEAEELFDFGGNLYAVQSFSHLNRRLALDWISALTHTKRHIRKYESSKRVAVE